MNCFPNSPLVTTDFIFDGGILFSLGLYLCTETHYTGISPLKYILIDDQLSHFWVMEPVQLGFLVCLKERKKKNLVLNYHFDFYYGVLGSYFGSPLSGLNYVIVFQGQFFGGNIFIDNNLDISVVRCDMSFIVLSFSTHGARIKLKVFTRSNS